MADHSTTGGFVPPPFSAALMGHFIIGLIKAVAIALLLWGLGLTGWTMSFPVEPALLTACVVMLAVESATTAVERVFVLRHRHPNPGSIPMTVLVTLLPPPISFLVGLLATWSSAGALIVMAASTVVYWAFIVTLEQPWDEGESEEEIRRKIELTKEMTREHFRSE